MAEDKSNPQHVQSILQDIAHEINKEHDDGSERSGNKRVTFILLFRARTPEELEKFHVKCDGKGPTLTVLHGKYNVCFGGYTSQNWSGGKKVTRKDKQSFLFYKYEHERAKIVFLKIKDKHKYSRAITCGSEFGPTFGGTILLNDYDLQTFSLGDKTKNKMEDSYLILNGKMNFGVTYKCEGKQPAKNDINNGKMEVKTIEVYQVVDDSLEEMWREKPTDEAVLKMRNELLNCEPLGGFGQFCYNILLVGVIQAGKSSFYNTLASVFAGKCAHPATTARGQTSVTNKVHVYKLHDALKRKLCVNIIDIRGYEEERNYDHELEHLLNGKLPDAYVFPENAKPISVNELRKCPKFADEMHLVCFVVDVEKLQLQVENGQLADSLQNIQKIIRQKDIPVAAVATKLDLLCPNIEKDADTVYDSPKARDAVLSVANSLGLDEKYVFPIVNYTNEKQILPAKDRLAIQALHSMVHFAEEYLKKNLQAHEQLLTKTIQSEFQELLVQLKDKTLKILFVGAVNSGKSSLIDSMISSSTGKIFNKATGCSTRDDTTEESVTERFKLYRWKYSDAAGVETTSNVIFGDMPGFQQSGGVELEHVKLVINGKVGNKSKIKYGLDKTNKRYKNKPSVTDKMNCVCIVVDIISVESVSPNTWETLKDLIKWLKRKGIPCVVILTKLDLLNQQDSKKTQSVDLYSRIPKQKENTDAIVKKLAIKENLVFPVQNYVHEPKISPDIDVRLLNAFQAIVNMGIDRLHKDSDDESTESSDSDESEHDRNEGQERASTDEH